MSSFDIPTNKTDTSYKSSNFFLPFVKNTVLSVSWSAKKEGSKIKIIAKPCKEIHNYFGGTITHDTTTLHLSSKLLVEVCTQEYYELTNHFDLQNLLTQAVLLSQLHEG